jgi:peptidoglycan hydrolase-like protein with peptidoglycan-binding domain
VRRALVAGALLAAVAAGAALALTGGSGGGSAKGAAAKTTGLGTVQRRTLAERLTAGGVIAYAGGSTVLARLSGTVTALPAVGDTIRRGEQLYALGGEPVLLMYGKVPAYRDLGEGVDDGTDVLQLEQNLAALGYEPGTVDEEFTASTASAVSAWQEDLGLEATGVVELGRVAFLPGPRRVTEVEATLGESIGSGGGGGGLTAGELTADTTVMAAYRTPSAERIEPAEETSEEPEEPREEEEEEERKEPEERGQKPDREAEEEEAPHEEAAEPEGEEQPEQEGEASDPASVPILGTSSTRRVVKVELSPDQQSVARRGQRVGVVLPGGQQTAGKVQKIVATEGSSEEVPGGESEPGVEVTVSVIGKTKAPAIDGAAVSVLFTESVRKQVLSVPLTALVAVGNDRFAVIAVQSGGRRRIAVTPGLAADGYVEVEGKGLHEGMRVETGK